nr:hypothetical protein [Sweet potato chlorotic stunt virus]QYA73055.1 hypothetical protein [Sweet potato chlorotic stunt virus]QYA73075.1 hypothetical protein [Sweet potato chlorotic stunt virus]QYA73089.1 hypothetical protein [Sweet potato chlorotic stunt virus]QYA73150.1 hypothetical protein [Sweet potato chlorotic stunt virus]
MDYSFMFNECYNKSAIYNPSKCNTDIALLWTVLSFIIFVLITYLIVVCLNLRKISRY